MHSSHDNRTQDPATLACLLANPGIVAMQYSYTLPADYDMSIIRQRVASKGHLLNGFPNLIFKAFTFAASDDNTRYSRENLYAPIYLWQNAAGINQFFENRGFAALVQTFGWPQVRIWSVWCAQLHESFPSASWATRECKTIPPFSELEQLRQQETDKVAEDINTHQAVAAFTAFEPTHWSLVRFRLWRHRPPQPADTATQVYENGYLAMA